MSNTETERAKALRNIGPSSIVTVDNVPAEDVVSLKVYVDPVQDLHGYDHPWPAGGGVNELDVLGRSFSSNTPSPETIVLEGCTATRDGYTITAIARGAWSKLRFQLDTSRLVNGQTYTMSATFNNPSEGSVGLAYYDGAWKSSKTSRSQNVKLSITFTYSGQQLLLLGFIINNTASGTGNTVTVSELQFEKGSSVSAWSPYSNICPISARTGANVTRTGKNLLPNSLASSVTLDGITATKDDDGVITLTGQGNGSVNPFFYLIGENGVHPLLLKAGQYTLSQGVVLPTNNMLRVTTNNATIAQCQGVGSVSFTLTDDTYVNVYMRVDKNADFTTPVKVYPLICIASDTDYTPYSGTTYPITFPTEAGTVYGGTLDVTKGTLTVTHGIITVDGTNIKCTVVSGGPSNAVPSVVVSDIGNGVVIASNMKSVDDVGTVRNTPNSIMSGMPDVTRILINANGIVRYGDGYDYATQKELIDAANAYIALNPITIVYPVATPITYQLTPTQITLLEGVNNVWADCGDILKMRYWSYDLLLNKVVYDNNTLIDLTGDTITPEVMLAGYTAHDATGSEIEGNIEIATMAEVQTYFGLS